MPDLKFRPNKNILKTAEYSSIFLIAFSSLFVARKSFSAAPPASGGQSVITVQTWDQIDNSNNNDADPGGATQLLQGLNATGSAAAALYQGSGATAKNGDLIELGYYQLADNSANPSGTNLFAGTWRPLTTKTTIGHVYDGSFWSDTSKAGEFFFHVKFARNTTGAKLFEGTADINVGNDSGYEISDDTPSGLGGNGAGHLYNLDAATYNETLPASARLGLRFYDVSQGATSGWAGPGSDNRGSATKYQTIMNPDWKWDVLSGDNNAAMYIHLHNNDGSVNTNLQFEFDNTDARSGDSRVGTGDGGANPNGFQLLNDDFVTTIAYHDGSSGMNLGTSGIGSAIVSGFTGTGTIDGKNDGNILTINSMAGNTGTNAKTFSGDIYQDGTTSTDLTIIKEGAGEQILSGNVNASDSNNAAASAYLDIQEGTLILRPGDTLTQKFEYLTSASSGTRALALDNTDDNLETTIELGFAQASTATFSGTVTLQGDKSQNTIKVVSSGTDDAAYSKEQIISGVISEAGGAKKLIKDGVGRLNLQGNNSYSGGTEINHGTVHVGNGSDDADLGSGTVTINKGKLEVGDGDTVSNTVNGGTGKSMIGGAGTFSGTNKTLSSVNYLAIGSGDISTVSPGQGISSSLTSKTSQQQVTFGAGSADDAMGILKVNNLALLDGGVYDWEISDFTGSAGTGFDVLQFDKLAFDEGSNKSFAINVFSVNNSTGNAGGGASSGIHTGTNGILFLDSVSNNHNDVIWGGVSDLGNSGWSDASEYFTVNDSAYNYHHGGLNGGWSVWYNGSGDFYMRYSAVPEPSTYVMVLGMLLAPGFRFFRRFRKGIKEEDQ